MYTLYQSEPAWLALYLLYSFRKEKIIQTFCLKYFSESVVYIVLCIFIQLSCMKLILLTLIFHPPTHRSIQTKRINYIIFSTTKKDRFLKTLIIVRLSVEERSTSFEDCCYLDGDKQHNFLFLLISGLFIFRTRSDLSTDFN